MRPDTEVNSVSVRGESVFLKEVGEFLREEVRAVGFKSNYVLNLKDQMRMRSVKDD